jgi:hypothetical protein
MKLFSDDDLFYKGFVYGMRLSNEGLMPVLDETTPLKDLMKSIENLDRAKGMIDDLIGELSHKVKEGMYGGNYETLS